MRHGIIINALVLAITLIPVMTGAEVVKVQAIEIKGLEHLSKYDIIRGVKRKTAQDGIYMDMKSLEKKLSRSPVIDRYRVRRSGGRLVITIRERRPAYTILVRSGDRVIPLELDRDFKPVSRGKLYFNILPYIYIGTEDIENGTVSSRVKDLCRLLHEVKKEQVQLYNELEEVYLSGTRVKVILNKRKTEFTLKPVKKRFTMLAYMVGYLDRIGRYPSSVLITRTRAVIR